MSAAAARGGAGHRAALTAGQRPQLTASDRFQLLRGRPDLAVQAAQVGDEVVRVAGILNGTCNFILSAMTEHNRGYGVALVEAQRSGYAEADPTLDVDGSDTAHKLAILARAALFVASILRTDATA